MKRLPLIFEKNEKKIANNLCRSIADQLSNYYSTDNSPGILNGLGGISCFFFHYSSFSGEKEYQKHGYLCLEKVIQAINEGFYNPSYATGLAGIHWLFRYLGKMGFISQEEAGTLSGLETIFLSYAKECLTRGDCDFLHGALGMAMTDSNKELFDIIVNELNNLSKGYSDDTLFWESRDTKDGTSEINLGLAHGIPSILLMLGNIYKINGDCRILENQIIPGMNFLISQMDKTTGADSIFPSLIREGKTKRPSRMAWCYGDPGVANAVYQLGCYCSSQEWKDLAVEILLHGTNRRAPENTRVEDACICHGSAGLALIYYNAWLKTGHQQFYDTARHWIEATLDYAGQHGEFLFKGLNGFEPKNNLLEGIAGVGLSLLAMTEGYLPGWEKSLLIN